MALRLIRNAKTNAKALISIIKNNASARQANSDANILAQYNKIKDIPDSGDQSDPNFRIKTMASQVRYRRDPAYRAKIDNKLQAIN